MTKHLIGEFENAGATDVIEVATALPRQETRNALGQLLTDPPQPHIAAEAFERISVQVNLDTGTAVEVALEGTNGNPFDPQTPWAELTRTSALGASDSELLQWFGAVRNVRLVVAAASADGTGDVAVFMR